MSSRSVEAGLLAKGEPLYCVYLLTYFYSQTFPILTSQHEFLEVGELAKCSDARRLADLVLSAGRTPIPLTYDTRRYFDVRSKADTSQLNVGYRTGVPTTNHIYSSLFYAHWPLHMSTCASRNLQLRTGGFCTYKVLLPACSC